MGRENPHGVHGEADSIKGKQTVVHTTSKYITTKVDLVE
jgi:hypothetical protein